VGRFAVGLPDCCASTKKGPSGATEADLRRRKFAGATGRRSGGSRVYLPVLVEDALVFFGDPHAAISDGIITRTGIECSMSVHQSPEGPRTRAADYRIIAQGGAVYFVGVGPSVEEATEDAAHRAGRFYRRAHRARSAGGLYAAKHHRRVNCLSAANQNASCRLGGPLSTHCRPSFPSTATTAHAPLADARPTLWPRLVLSSAALSPKCIRYSLCSPCWP
jgi:hypothetical protein